MRVLIIEDNEDVAANVGDFLARRGDEVDFAYDGLGGLHLALTQPFDAIVLDLGLPGMDGLSLCRRLRQDARSTVPILMLTARDTLPDTLSGFDAGTDDYMIKPFALQELAARLDALARRARPSRGNRLCVGDLDLDPATRIVRRQGRPIDLNPTCFLILRVLMEASPKVVDRARLEHAVWGEAVPESDALRSHIYAIRQAIDRGFETPLLRTLRGVGYRLAAQEE
jgi:DNA-binding response OmpR family regulator